MPSIVLLVVAVVTTATLAFAAASRPTHTRRAPTTNVAATPKTASLAVSYLYVVQGATASSAPAANGYELTLNARADSMVRFTDRPARDTAHQKISDFVSQWSANGFVADPPNAALAGVSGDKQYDVAVELTAPRWDPATKALAFHVRPLVAGTTLPTTFDDISLFIDNAGQNTVQLNLTNLTSIPLSIQSVTPDSSDWSTADGNVPTVIGYDFGLVSANGTDLNLAFSNESGLPMTASVILIGDYENQWQLSISWGPNLVPVVTVTQFSGSGIALAGPPFVQGAPIQLTNLSPDVGNTAIYQAILQQSQN